MWKIIHWVKEAVLGLFRNITLNLLAILMSVICLSILAIGMILGLNANHLASVVEKNMGVSIYLKDEVIGYEEVELKIKEIGGIQDVRFTSKDEAFEQMKIRLGKDHKFFTSLNRNPLNAYFFVTLDNPKDIRKVAKTIETWGITTEVNYGEDVVQRLFSATDSVKQMAFWLIALSGMGASGMIFIAIKINIFNRNKEIEIKDLVGAGMFNIRIPFILEAVIMSMTAVFLVLGTVYVGYDKLMLYVTSGLFTNYLPLGELLSKLVPLMVLIALTIALVGSFISTQRYLKRH